MADGPALDCTGAARKTKAASAADGYLYSLVPVLEGKWLTLVYLHLIDSLCMRVLLGRSSTIIVLLLVNIFL